MKQTKPNILFLMTDQMQGKTLQEGNPCLTPNLDRLAARGVKFSRAYCSNPVCSPARASLMTGLLPHNHGVKWVTHTIDTDQGLLRTRHKHWAEYLKEAGYETAYFGKWHVENTNKLEDFGWDINACAKSGAYKQKRQKLMQTVPENRKVYLTKTHDLNPGYRNSLFYEVRDTPVEHRNLGPTLVNAAEYLDKRLQDTSQSWCCFVSIVEPHDPFVATKEYYDMYDVDELPVPENFSDEMADKPGLYRKAARIWKDLGIREKKEAMACYYASITEIDHEYGKLIRKIEDAGQADNTIIIFTTDHGEALGAHGLYCKNVGAFEEIYNIPLIMAGTGIAQGKVSAARASLHDMYPTILDLTDTGSCDMPDCKSLLPVLQDPERNDKDFGFGYAEYEGTRYNFSQRVVWDNNWKFVFNGFDEDELYDLEKDPGELKNLINDPVHQSVADDLMKKAWERIVATGDTSLINSHYPVLRLGRLGPDVLRDE